MHRWLGADLAKAGRDPMPEYQAALRCYERAVTIDPQYLFACTNQVDVHATLAEYKAASGSDPRTTVDDARRVGERCLTMDPNYDSLLDTLAQVESRSRTIERGSASDRRGRWRATTSVRPRPLCLRRGGASS